jgi:outer membrane lipoprotein carrier protein
LLKRASLLSILIILLISSTSYGITAEEIVTKLQGIYDKAESYTADFFQESELGSLKRVKKANGIAYFKKNGRMYWEYKEPTKQKFVSNGKKVWLYQPDMNQVQVHDYAALNLTNTENSFLDGVGNLMKDFDVKYNGVEVDGSYVLELKPKDAAIGFQEAAMHVDKKTFNIMRTVTTDAYGNHNTLIFKNTKFNVDINDDFFDFKIPDGVHVVTQDD